VLVVGEYSRGKRTSGESRASTIVAITTISTTITSSDSVGLGLGGSVQQEL
jgi:hypothetical protein